MNPVDWLFGPKTDKFDWIEVIYQILLMMIESNSNISMLFDLRDMSNFQLEERQKNHTYNKNIHRSNPNHKRITILMFISKLTLLMFISELTCALNTKLSGSIEYLPGSSKTSSSYPLVIIDVPK